MPAAIRVVVFGEDEEQEAQVRDAIDAARGMRALTGLQHALRASPRPADVTVLLPPHAEALERARLQGADAYVVRAEAAPAADALVAAVRAAHRPPAARPLRLPVTNAINIPGSGLGWVVTGAVAAGQLRAGDAVAVAPSGSVGTIGRIELAGGVRATEAGTGADGGFELLGVSGSQMRRGSVLSHAADPAPPQAAAAFTAKLAFTYDQTEDGLVVGDRVFLDVHVTPPNLPARLAAVTHRLDRRSRRFVPTPGAAVVGEGEVVIARFVVEQTGKPLVLERFAASPVLGRVRVHMHGALLGEAAVLAVESGEHGAWVGKAEAKADETRDWD